MLRTANLPNGMPIIAYQMAGRHTVDIRLGLFAGSRFEEPDKTGAAHLLEHMLFQGAGAWETSTELNAHADQLGLDIGAYTGHEEIVLWARCLPDRVLDAAQLLAAMVIAPKLPGGELLERERQVVTNEIALRRDDDSQYSWELVYEGAFRDHAYGRPITGLDVPQLTADDLRGWHREHFQPVNAVVVLAGNVHEKALHELHTIVGGHWAYQDFAFDHDLKPPAGYDDRIGVERDTEQAHLSYLWRADAFEPIDRAAMAMMGMALGGTMNSRLFRTVREEMGIAYSVHAWGYTMGPRLPALLVSAAVDPSRARDADEAIRECLDSPAFTAEEFDAAKTMWLARKAHQADTPKGQASSIMAASMGLGGPPTEDEWISIGEQVTHADVLAQQNHVATMSPAVGYVGPNPESLFTDRPGTHLATAPPGPPVAPKPAGHRPVG